MEIDKDWFIKLIREEINDALRQADREIQQMKVVKKQNDIMKTRDNLAKKQKQLSDLKKPKSAA